MPDRTRLLVVFCVSFAAHILYSFSPLARAHFFPMDESLYWDLAENLADHGRLSLSTDAFATVRAGEKTLFWTPVYPLLLAALLKTGPHAALWLKLIQACLAALAPILLFPVARKILSGWKLWAFILLAACYPYYFQLASQTASESLALFLSLASLAIAAGWRRTSIGSMALLGACLACLCLTRPEFLVFAFAVMGWTAVRALRPRTPQSLRLLSALAAGFAMAMLPWLARNYAITGSPEYTTRSGYSLAYQNEYLHLRSRGKVGGEAEWAGTFPAFASEIERYRYLKRRAVGFIREHPSAYLSMCLKRLASPALPDFAKRRIYRILGRRDIKEMEIPAWYRFSNAVFLLGLWGLVLPSALRCLRRADARPRLDSIPGLLLIILLGQALIYVLFAYVEYQRSILDLEALLLGAALWGSKGAQGAEGAEGAQGAQGAG